MNFMPTILRESLADGIRDDPRATPVAVWGPCEGRNLHRVRDHGAGGARAAAVVVAGAAGCAGGKHSPLFTWFFEIWAVRTGRIDGSRATAVPSTPSVNSTAA
jgi:hypothetical protein